MNTDYDPYLNFNQEFAPQNTLTNLSKIQQNFIDIAIIDGNHDAAYLYAEINSLESLLKSEGILILDDIEPNYWKELFEIFQTLDKSKFETIFTNNRIAAVRYHGK